MGYWFVFMLVFELVLDKIGFLVGGVIVIDVGYNYCVSLFLFLMVRYMVLASGVFRVILNVISLFWRKLCRVS